MSKIKTLSHYDDPKFHQAFRQYYEDLGISNFKYWDRLFDDMAKEVDINTYLLIEEDEIIGFIQCQKIELEHWFFKEQMGFIREFWTHKQVRNQGNGDLLLDHALSQFEIMGLKKIILTSEKIDTFFVNRGFVVDASYRALNTDHVMVKIINDSSC